MDQKNRRTIPVDEILFHDNEKRAGSAFGCEYARMVLFGVQKSCRLEMPDFFCRAAENVRRKKVAIRNQKAVCPILYYRKAVRK